MSEKEFKCWNCGHEEKISQDEVIKNAGLDLICPECKKAFMRREWATAVHFKGEGFAVNDG